MMKSVVNSLKKVLLFGLYGGGGCLAGAIVSEILLPVGDTQWSGVFSPSFWRVVVLTGAWTALLALGLALALAVGQNLYLAKPPLSLTQGLTVGGGAILVGLISGGIAQTLFGLVGQIGFLRFLSWLAAWGLMGAMLGRGIGIFIANMDAKRAMIAGAIGGLVGAYSFDRLTTSLGETPGRLTATIVLGFAIGMMVILVEVIFREAWLQIDSDQTQGRTINLGESPVCVGSDRQYCSIYVQDAPPIAFRYTLQDSQVQCEDVVARTTRSVTPGDQREIGDLRLTVAVPNTMTARRT